MADQGKRLRVLVVGVGNMGRCHARAYAEIDGFDLAGLCARSAASRDEIAEEFPGVPLFASFDAALDEIRPDVVSINTFPDTHADYAIRSMRAGAHVFLEKPLARTVEEAEQVVATAVETGRKLVVGYILRVHPAWTKLIEEVGKLGKPLVMRMNLNQQGDGEAWQGMRNLMMSLSPLIDCGVHYVDMMCLATGARPIHVQGIGARLSAEVSSDVYNYGQLQVVFDDGSIGWYEAGWGPMMSTDAASIKDFAGPLGSASLVSGSEGFAASDIEGHTSVAGIRVHSAKLGSDGLFSTTDRTIPVDDAPSHDELCALEQRVLLDAIKYDRDLSAHMRDAVESLRIVLAADESIRTGKVIEFGRP